MLCRVARSQVSQMTLYVYFRPLCVPMLRMFGHLFHDWFSFSLLMVIPQTKDLRSFVRQYSPYIAECLLVKDISIIDLNTNRVSVEFYREQVVFSSVGDSPSNPLDQDVERTRSQDMEPEVRPLISQQQDERSSHDVTTFDQPGTPDLRREFHRFLIKPKWRFCL